MSWKRFDEDDTQTSHFQHKYYLLKSEVKNWVTKLLRGLLNRLPKYVRIPWGNKSEPQSFKEEHSISHSASVFGCFRVFPSAHLFLTWQCLSRSSRVFVLQIRKDFDFDILIVANKYLYFLSILYRVVAITCWRGRSTTTPPSTRGRRSCSMPATSFVWASLVPSYISLSRPKKEIKEKLFQ